MVGGASGVCGEEEEEESKLNLWGSVTSGRNINRNVNRKMIESLQTGSKQARMDR